MRLRARSRLPRRRLAALVLLSLVALVLVALPATTLENADDPRNLTHGVLWGGNPSQDCWSHHRIEGMADSHYLVPLFPRAVEVGVPRELQLQIVNGWTYRLSELTVQVTLAGSGPDNRTHLALLAGDATHAPPPRDFPANGRLGHPLAEALQTASPRAADNHSVFPFELPTGAISLHLELDLSAPETPEGTGDVQVRAELEHPGGYGIELFPRSDPQALARHLDLPFRSGIDTIAPVPGPYALVLDYDAGTALWIDWTFNATIQFATTQANTYTVLDIDREPPGEEPDPKALVPSLGASSVIAIPIQGLSPGVQVVDVMVEAQLYWDHDNGGTPDQDWFRRYVRVEVLVGDSYVPTDAQLVAGGVSATPLALVTGELTGYAAGLLLVPSLVLGGTYGRASRRWMNTVLGGAKRRVMFHSTLSLGLSAAAAVHLVLFTMEVRYSLLMGVLWGGLALVGLLVLGLTGYYQVPLIQRWGFPWWRRIHLATGLLVLGFTGIHAALDGADFSSVRDVLPAWAQDWNPIRK